MPQQPLFCKGRCLSSQDKHRVSAAGPSTVLNFGSEPSYLGFDFLTLRLLLLLAEKPCHCPAPELPFLAHSVRKAHFKGWWGAELQLGTHIRWGTSLAPSNPQGPHCTVASSPLGGGVLQETIGPALHPLLMLMYVTGAGVARRQYPPPRALRSQRGSALVM